MGRERIFRFKQFTVTHERSAMKLGTDAVLLGAWCDALTARNALDVGTGCGIIALMLAQRNPSVTVHAIDIDHDSAIEAALNFGRSPWIDRLQCHEADFNAWQGSYDLIVSNPPYFIDGVPAAQPARDRARHTRSLTLDQLIGHSCHLLTPDGRLALIVPSDTARLIAELAAFHSLHIARLCEVFPVEGQPSKRLLCELTAVPATLTRERLMITFANGQYTPQYIDLCSAFYLKM